MSEPSPTSDPQVRALPVWLSVLVILGCLGGGAWFVWWYFSGSPGSRVEVVRIDPESIPTKFPGTKLPNQKELFEAVDQNDVAKVKALLGANKELARAKNGKASGATPLHFAAFNNNAEIAGMLLDAGADLEAVDAEYQSRPIGWATYSGKPAMVEFLIARGAKIDEGLLGMAKSGVNGQLGGTPGKVEDFRAIVTLYRKNGVMPWTERPFPQAVSGEDLPELPAAKPGPAGWGVSTDNLLSQLRGVGCVEERVVEDGASLVRVNIGDADDRGLVLPTVYNVPCRIEVAAKCNPNNLRLYFADGGVVLGWEVNPTELRFRPPSGGDDGSVAEKGVLPANQFVTVVWDIQPEGATLSVDGQVRHTIGGDFSKVWGRVGIGPAWSSTLSVKSIRVTATPH